MDIQRIKDGIMNYVRQIGPSDRDARDANLKPDFDFEGWLSALQSSAAEGSTDSLEEPDHQDGDGVSSAGNVATSPVAPAMAPSAWHEYDQAFFDNLTGGFHNLDSVATTSLSDWNLLPW
jgi:hypothetical protein